MSAPLRTWGVLCAALVLGGLVGGSAGCGSRTGRTAEPECVDSGDCDIQEGELIACVDGACENVECLASADCSLGSYCDTEGDFSCTEGCEQNSDCLAGFSCDGGECSEDDCRSTVLDCDFLEVCNEDNGECEQVGGVICARCETSGNEFDDNSTFGNFCDDTFLGHVDCGVGALCGGGSQAGLGHCMPPCETSADCPHGFQCQQLVFDVPCPEPILTTAVCYSTECGNQ